MNSLQRFDIPASGHVNYCTSAPWYPRGEDSNDAERR